MSNGEVEDATQKLILVIDDDALVRRAVARMLKRLGYQVFEAGSLAETLDMFREHNFDVVCCDGNLPGGDGHEIYDHVYRLLSESVPKRPMPSWFFLSGGHCDFAALRRRALLVTKPISPKQLELVLRFVQGDEHLAYLAEALIARDRALRG